MSKCSINGCDKPIMYKSRQICQMHYFRHMRNGTYETILARKKVLSHSSGYVVLYLPDHPLSRADGYVYEHRVVAYEMFGEKIPPCGFCGKPSSWEPYFTHIDHIDCDKANNNPSNLRVLCNACNVGRNKSTAHERNGIIGIEWNGEIKTANGWAKDKRSAIRSGAAIKRRLECGWSVENAIFTPSRTNKGKEIE